MRFAHILAVGVLLAACAPAATSPAPSGAGLQSPSVIPSATSSASSSAGAPASAGASATPGPVDPANFVARVDNPWYPLLPGTRWTYRGTRDGEAAVDVFEVTTQTKVIQGVRCVVVHDVLTVAGERAEDTLDWFAQDRDGNVWYFGEDTKELEGGNVVSTEGSWEAGVDGAQPGIFMPADPRVGYSGQQEFFPGHAEDRFVILQMAAKVKVRFGTFSNVLLTAEWTTLEPDVLGEKFYVRDVGLVKEIDVAGGAESLELTDLRKP